MKTIAIVGARPGIKAIPADEVWYVNSAISERPHFEGAARHIHIVAGTLQTAFEDSHRSSIHRGRIKSYANAKSDSLVVVGRRSAKTIYELLRSTGYRTDSISHINPTDQERTIQTITGLTYPIGLHRTFSYGLLPGLKITARSIRKFVKYAYLDRTIRAFSRWHRAYTPSNGIFALVKAMEDNGRDARYVLTGISLDPFTYEYRFGNALPRTGLRDHFIADEAILRKLRRCPVWSDDKGLCTRTGIRPLADSGDDGFQFPDVALNTRLG